MATGNTIGQDMAEMIEWAAAGKKGPRPACLNEMGFWERRRVLRALDGFVDMIRERSRALEPMLQEARVVAQALAEQQ